MRPQRSGAAQRVKLQVRDTELSWNQDTHAGQRELHWGTSVGIGLGEIGGRGLGGAIAGQQQLYGLVVGGPLLDRLCKWRLF